MRAVLILAMLAALGGTLGAQDEYRQAEKRIFHLINRERKMNQLPELVWDEDVAAAARAMAFNMAARRFFAHKDPVYGDLPERLTNRGIRWAVCSENLFMEMGHDDAVAEAVRGWMTSPGHRHNVLDKRVTHTGVGAAISADGKRHLVQIFILPRPAAEKAR